VSDTEERPATGAEAPAREQPRAEERAADQAVAEGSPGDLTMADRASEGNGGRRHARRRVVLGRRHARRRVVLGWAAATVGIAGLAWLLNSLITSWTSYATLTVTKWQMLTYGPRSAQLRFSVHNSGTGAAAGCTTHVQLGNGQVVSASSPAINPGGTVHFYLAYEEKRGPQTHPAYAWATCGAARSPDKPVATTADIGLITGNVQVTPGPEVTTVSFQEHNLGSQEAYSCRAVTRFPGRDPAPYGNAPADIRGGATAAFTIRYRSSLGRASVVWAQCSDPPASDGGVISTKAYLRPLFASS
jgi:hypothetical protein